jgi:hypothetical protein
MLQSTSAFIGRLGGLRERLLQLQLEIHYNLTGPERSNVRYGYVHGPVDHAVFT